MQKKFYVKSDIVENIQLNFVYKKKIDGVMTVFCDICETFEIQTEEHKNILDLYLSLFELEGKFNIIAYIASTLFYLIMKVYMFFQKEMINIMNLILKRDLIKNLNKNTSIAKFLKQMLIKLLTMVTKHQPVFFLASNELVGDDEDQYDFTNINFKLLQGENLFFIFFVSSKNKLLEMNIQPDSMKLCRPCGFL